MVVRAATPAKETNHAAAGVDHHHSHLIRSQNKFR